MPTPSQQVPVGNLSGNQPRRKRAARDFHIVIRSDGKTKGEEPKSENKVYENTEPPVLNRCSLTFHKIKKFTKRVKTGFSSLEDNLSLFANQVSTRIICNHSCAINKIIPQKLGHWALVVEAYVLPNQT